ncbi:MAG: DUF2950 domain-containing protein [Burkholderiaceae bacterium]
MNSITYKLTLAAVAGALSVLAPTTQAQKAYPSPTAAADALVDGLARRDGETLKAALGANYRQYIPTGGIDADDAVEFLAAWAASHQIVEVGAKKALLAAGTQGWTLPIPIVKTAAGWRFDPQAGADEMRTRRIGRNELAVMQVLLAYTDAQEEYAARDRNGDGVKEFATRFLSTPGRHDGLYWTTAAGEAESPMGRLVAEARPGQPFHGYLYRMLLAQGRDAPGGGKSYLRNAHMTEGYALLAWPARYGDTGVMSFMVSRAGAVYEKDLGPRGDATAKAMTSFNPDASWKKVDLK